MIDEVGYLTYGPEAANVLFHVVNDRHLRKRPMVFTTNKPLNEWGKVLHDEDMAAAILDRVLERGRFVHLDGPSGRTRHLNLEEVLPTSPERVRISGISGSEFPEPTLPGTITKNIKFRLTFTSQGEENAWPVGSFKTQLKSPRTSSYGQAFPSVGLGSRKTDNAKPRVSERGRHTPEKKRLRSRDRDKEFNQLAA